VGAVIGMKKIQVRQATGGKSFPCGIIWMDEITSLPAAAATAAIGQSARCAVLTKKLVRGPEIRG
jgi:hypothetical protein